ncbi:MAG: GMC oxidoreductase [Gemmatimonadaceae bacterium]
MTHDAIVVGSGPAGANAAAALIEGGRSVLMLDVGDVDARYEALIPPASFREIRQTDPAQHRYLLGDDFEGVSFGGVRVGAQLTPPRLYVTGSASHHMPVASDTFAAAESLALGGLGNAWGAGVFGFDERELAEWPVTRAELEPHYETVARRIGISADDDDLTAFFGRPAAAMPPLDIDTNAETVLRRYRSRREALNRQGFFMGRPPLAVCTTPHRGRGPHAYRDMDFWADSDRSVYRPRWTVDELRRGGRCRYVDRRLVLRFDEHADGVAVTTRHVDSGDLETFQGRALVLAAGTLSTARIVLRSLGRAGERVPLLCNPYTYVPVVNWAMLGRASRDRRHSLAQLSAVYHPGIATGGHETDMPVQAQLYSYRSLLTFRLLPETRVAYREGLRMMRLLMPALGIIGINHDDRRTPSKYCAMRQAASAVDSTLEVHYELTDAERARMDRHERTILRFFRQLGCWPIKRVRPGHGSSIHYAGTFPMRREPSGLTCAADGRLAATRAVHLVDGSTFPYLPAKGLTFTIMANANRIGTLLAQRLG